MIFLELFSSKKTVFSYHPSSLKRRAALCLVAIAFMSNVHASVDDALAFAYEASLPYAKQYAFRKDAWGGDLGVKEKKAVMAQLFKGNDYWFIMASDVKNAKISIHLYDALGKLAESEAWQRTHDKKHCASAGSHIIPEKTGTYFAIVEVLKSPEERTPWALVYGYKDFKEKDLKASK
jgi:hypothetical protein